MNGCVNSIWVFYVLTITTLPQVLYCTSVYLPSAFECVYACAVCVMSLSAIMPVSVGVMWLEWTKPRGQSCICQSSSSFPSSPVLLLVAWYPAVFSFPMWLSPFKSLRLGGPTGMIVISWIHRLYRTPQEITTAVFTPPRPELIQAPVFKGIGWEVQKEKKKIYKCSHSLIIYPPHSSVETELWMYETNKQKDWSSVLKPVSSQRHQQWQLFRLIQNGLSDT